MKLLSRGLLLLPLLAVIPAGCSSATNAAKFSGRVSYNGNPVPGGTLTLHPKTEGAVGGTASIGADGRFEATNLPTGEFTVTIETEFLNPEKNKAPAYGGGSGPGGGAGPKYGGPGGGPGGGKGGADPKKKQDFSPRPDTAVASSTTYMKIPEKYNAPATSGLTVTLSNGSNSKDFNLTD